MTFHTLYQALPAIPTCENTLCFYGPHLASVSKLKHVSIKCYLSAIRHLQITEGYSDPFKSEMPRLDYVMKGIKRTQGELGLNKPNPRLPITPEVLRRLRAVWLPSQARYKESLLWAVACIVFFGFLH